MLDGERVNYVLCAWSGDRRTPDDRRKDDPALYLREHIASLKTLPHSLAQITIMVARNPSEPTAFRSFLMSLPEQIQGTPLVIVERENVGLSYGGLSDCYVAHRDAFDFYMLMEDDYVFTQPHFDELHLCEMRQNPTCGYMCGLAWGEPIVHAGIANGMLRGTALEALFRTHGKLPHGVGADYARGEGDGQVAQSHELIRHGFELRDWAGQYQVGFRSVTTEILWYHANCHKTLMVPI